MKECEFKNGEDCTICNDITGNNSELVKYLNCSKNTNCYYKQLMEIKKNVQ